jgi:hypothetical protein
VGGDGLFSFDTVCETLGINPEICAPGIAVLAKRRDYQNILTPKFGKGRWLDRSGIITSHKKKLNAEKECL